MTSFSQPFRPEAVLKIGWRRRWQIVLPAIVIAAGASAWIHRLPDRYQSEALLLVVPQRVPETFVRSTVATRGEQRLQSITQQILSRTQLERIIHDFDLYEDRRATDTMQDIVDSMRTRDIEVRPVKGDAFRLAFSAATPDVAMRVAQRLVSLFVAQPSLDRATLAEGADQFLEAQLEDARRKLIDNETRLEEYRSRHNGELPTQLEANIRGLHNTEVQLQVLADALNRDHDRRLLLERSLKDANLSELIDARPPAGPGDGATPSAAVQLERAEAVLEEMQSTMTDQHPDVVALKQSIGDLRRKAAIESARQAGSPESTAADALRRSRLDGLRAELSAIEEQIARKAAQSDRLRANLLGYQRRIDAAPAREGELAALTRDYETLQQTYRGLLAKKQESEIAANLERQQVDAHFKVLDPARLPEQPFAPRRSRLYAIAVLLAVGMGVMLGVTLEWFDRGLRTPEDVRAALGLPVLAAIPLVRARRWRFGRTAAVVSVGAATFGCVAAIAWRLVQ